MMPNNEVDLMKIKQYRNFVGDFETTVYDGQKTTEVWASACVELGSEDVKIFSSISEQFNYLKNLDTNIRIYYHNLKFDGSFWLSFLLTDLKFEQAYNIQSDDKSTIEWQEERFMSNNSFKYSISELGQWYTIIIKVHGHYIEIRDSLKLLPFSLRRIGESFKTKHQKLEMEYTGFRYSGCVISNEEQEYIKNDALVIKEALEIMFEQGHDSLTIGGCCLEEFKRLTGKEDFEVLFPNLYEIEIGDEYGSKNVGEYIKRSYRGGWCYLVKGKESREYNNGTTADVNSLYPSMMSSESGNIYPYGKPTFWKGDYIPEQALLKSRYYFIRVKTRFKLKHEMLPTIQIKHSYLYKATDMLETSDILDPDTGEYSRYFANAKGEVFDTSVIMTLTMTDYELIKEHYHLIDFEILDGCYFQAGMGFFDEYIEKYKTIKLMSKGALRELAKLFLNNLYGKMASSTNSSFKVCYEKEDGSLGFFSVLANDKKPGYIAIGSAITSYSRNFTIRTAQKNYHGVDSRGFIYADTDSIHCDLEPNEIQGIKVHDKNFCCWKLESCWDKAIFVRAKTYIERVTHEDLEPIENPYYNIKCAGMPERCKSLLNKSLTAYTINNKEEYESTKDKYKKEEQIFIEKNRELTDFKLGLIVPSKLLPKRIKGGVLLVSTTFEMR